MDARPPAPSRAPRPPFVCSLGWHAPQKGALWNQGYYFTRCTRCGVDLVRTTFSGWEAPRGQRVVWRNRAEIDQPDQPSRLPPPTHSRAPLVPRTAPSPSTATRPPPPPRRRPTPTNSAVPDFMDEPEPTPERPSAVSR